VARFRRLPEPQPVLGLVVQVQRHHLARCQHQRAQPQVDVPALQPVRPAVLLVVREIMLYCIFAKNNNKV
jgi:hypothetical protein